MTEQVTDDTEVMTAELKVKMQVADLKLVIELLGLIRDFLRVVTFEEISEEKQCPVVDEHIVIQESHVHVPVYN